MIADGMKHNPQKYQEMLVEEALPLIYHKTPDLSNPNLICRLFTVSLEYYIRQIIDEAKCDTSEVWKKNFQVLMLCGKIQHWETFLPFNKSWYVLKIMTLLCILHFITVCKSLWF